MKLHLLILLCLLVGLRYAPAQTFQIEALSATEQLETNLQLQLNQIVSEYDLPGITMAVAFDESHIINLAAGYADKEAKVKMEPNQRMLSGSVGKTFVSAVALLLWERGQFRLDDPLSKYLGNEPWFKDLPNGKDIRLQDLLNHTSGMPRYILQEAFLEDFKNNLLKERSPADCIAFVLNKAPLHAAGEGWAYSDTNYLLLGLVLEKITGKTYYQLQRELLLKPLELKLTEPTTGRTFANLAQGYVGEPNFFSLPNKMLTNGTMVLQPAFEWTGGGLVTHVKDLARWMKKLHEGEVLQDSTYQLLIQAKALNNGRPAFTGYGLGTFVWQRADGTRFGHSGFFPGYVTQVEYSQKRHYAIAVQINLDSASPLLGRIIAQLDAIIDESWTALTEEKIKANFDKQARCWNAGDLDCYMEAYAQSEPIQTISRGGVRHGYDNILANYKKHYPKDKMGQLHFDELATRRLDDHLYFVTGRYNLKYPDQEELKQGRFSVVLKRIDGQWLMITDHSG